MCFFGALLKARFPRSTVAVESLVDMAKATAKFDKEKANLNPK